MPTERQAKFLPTDCVKAKHAAKKCNYRMAEHVTATLTMHKSCLCAANCGS